MKFWTDDRLQWVHDVALPKHTTVEAALRAAELRWKRSLARRSFETQFKKKFNITPRIRCAASEFIPDVNHSLTTAENPIFLRKRIKALEKELKVAKEQGSVASIVKSICNTCVDKMEGPPDCIISPQKKSGKMSHGVPTLFVSDIHHGETVSRAEMGGCNEFDMEISRARTKHIFERSVYIVDNVFTPSDYPGIVLALGGDMVSGSIHDEIRESNEMPIFDVVLDLVDTLRAGINYLLERFPVVYVPCVVGNHGRLDRKPRMKHGPQENYEYILYHLLKRSYEGNDRVIIDVSDSFVHHYRVYGTRYALTHGDQFSGGTGIAGPATPWALGDHKLRKQMAAIEGWTGIPSEYDILLFGHFHQLTFMKTMICNGSIKGFDEYAKKKNYSFEPPQQALWFTHQDLGVTFPVPVFAEDLTIASGKGRQWVSLLK